MVGAKPARVAFLRGQVAKQREKIKALAPLNHQTALLLLRQCVSADLRHLQRSLRTDDMKEEWDPLDLALWDEVKRIRGRPDIEGPEGIEDDCIGRNAATLPVRYGGLGLVSHADVSPHARAASAVTADEVIDKIFGTTSEMEEDSPSQSKRCTQMWEEQRSRLMGDVDSVRAAVLLENASVIGRQWIKTQSPTFIHFVYPIPRSPLASAFALWPSPTGQRANAVSKPISYTTRSAVRLLKRPGTITSEISLRSFFANDLRPTSLPNLTRRRAVGGTT